MFKPTYRITPFLIKCLEEISSRKIFLDQAGKRSSLGIKIARDSFNRNVHSSTWIEGNTLSLAQVAALSAKRGVVAEEQQKREVQNCIKALRWMIKSSRLPLTGPKILNLHMLMTKGLLPTPRCGQYRKVQNYIVNAKNQVIFTPPAPAKVKQRINGLLKWLKTNHKEHPIIRSAVFHHEFVTIHPFVDGNGRVARGAAQWLLLQNGYDPAWTLSLDEFFAQDRVKYYDMIQQTRDLDGDFTYWIEYVAKGLSGSVQAVVKRLKEETRKSRAFTPKQGELLRLLEKNGVMGSAQIGKQMKVNRARVNQIIGPMVKAKVVVKEGSARAVRYSLA